MGLRPADVPTASQRAIRPLPIAVRRTLDWREGGTSWTQDYPRADRHFAAALRRLTRVNVRSVEQPVNLDDGDDVYNWPWLCAGEMGDWKLTDAQAKKLREYLLRGGFLMLDDFWGTEEWDRFEESMQLVFPDRPIVEIERRGRDLSHRLRSRRPLPDSRPVGACGGGTHVPQRRRRWPTGAESTTTTAA